MGCEPYRWTEVVVGTVLGLLATGAAVVAAVTFYQCTNHSLLNYWLMFHGVITLGALLGIAVWRLAPIPGRYINGLTYLTGFLIFLNLAWLLLGNVAVGLVYSICFAGSSSDAYLDIDINCSSRILPLTLSVVVIFDVLYVILLAMLCAQTCNCQPKCEKEEDSSYLSQWWGAVVAAVVLLILSVVAIAVGATYLYECYEQDWGAIWLLVFGCVKITILILGLFWMRYRPETGKLWDAPASYLSLPTIVLLLLHIIFTSTGNMLMQYVRKESCEGAEVCSNVLQVTEIVVVSLFQLLAATIIYYGVVFVLVALFFFMVTFCYYCCGDAENDLDEVVPIKQQEA